MKDRKPNIFKSFLFSRHILVNGKIGKPGVLCEEYGEVLLSLAKLFNIRITSGGRLADPTMIRFCSEMLGEDVPKAFYQGFPQSVRKLMSEDLLFDQMLTYFVTYGLGDFSQQRHSVLENEEDLVRSAFKEEGTIKDFEIVDGPKALEKLASILDSMLAGTRPLNASQIELAASFCKTFGFFPKKVASKNTAVMLLLETGDIRFSDFLSLSDVTKLLDAFLMKYKQERNPKKLNLKNQERKLFIKVIDRAFESGKADIEYCYEKKKIWCGLLHHIHYQPKCEKAKEFLANIRRKENLSAYSSFEKKLREEGALAAADDLLRTKGSGALFRQLHYLVSRCESKEEIDALLSRIDTNNAIILLQLYAMYPVYKTDAFPRVFQFIKCNLQTRHTETEEEMARRRSRLSEEQVAYLSSVIEEKLRKILFGRLGKVYIDPEMERYAVPLKESATQGGLGVLASGSHFPMERAKKIRAFTYWEKVDDIDLAVIALSEKGEQKEFSWRTMFEEQSPAITYSGDETSGYNGGSEYYDIDVEMMKKEYPDYRYLVFTDNVFSNLNFSQCICKAGYMVRDKDDSGEIFEPKTVSSSFVVNCPSRFVYLFGLDMETFEFFWLNSAQAFSVPVAGITNMSPLLNQFKVTDTLNLKVLFEMLAEEIVENMEEADVVVTNRSVTVPDHVEVIREYDFERILALLEKEAKPC
ncbi:MAG: hypothetical protein IKG93_10170 [Clostridiales bacterium]|nr:hypothetical protein [Clostridiales bacterium]